MVEKGSAGVGQLSVHAVGKSRYLEEEEGRNSKLYTTSIQLSGPLSICLSKVCIVASRDVPSLATGQ